MERELFFCGNVCAEDKKHPDRKKFQKAATLPFRTKLLEMCSQRMDDWKREAEYRVLDCHDFVAAETRYCNSCYGRLLTGAKQTWILFRAR